MVGRMERAAELRAKRLESGEQSFIDKVVSDVKGVALNVAQATGVGLDEQEEAVMNNSVIQALDSAHGETMEQIFLAEDSQRAELLSNAMENSEFRTTAVNAALENPQALKELVQTLDSSDPQFDELSNFLDNKLALHIAQSHPDIAIELANPQNAGNMDQLLNDYMSRTDVQNTVAEGVSLYREDAVALQATINSPQYDALLQIDQSELAVSVAAAKASGGNVQNQIITDQVGLEIDPIITLANNTVNPDAKVQAGEMFIDKVANELGGNTSAQVAAIKGNTELMGAIGESFASNGEDIKQTLIDGAKNGSIEDAFANLIEKDINLAKGVVPIYAAADPQAAAQTALEGMRESMLKSTKGLEGQELTDAQDYINDFANTMSTNNVFTSDLSARLADPQQAAQILDNMKSLDSVGGAGGFDGMKIVMEDMKNNPNDVMSIIASQEMIGRATERWGAEMANVKIDTMFANFDEALQNMSNGPMGNMLKNFGIDIDGIASSLGGFKNTLKELAGPMISGAGGTMASYQVAGGIIQGVNDNLDVMGVDETYFTGNTQDSMFANAMSALDKSKMLAAMSADAPEGWAARQSTALSARVIDGELHMVDPSTGKVTKHEIKPKPEPAPQVNQPAQGQQLPDLNQDSYGQQHNALDNNNRTPTPDPIVGV